MLFEEKSRKVCEFRSKKTSMETFRVSQGSYEN